MKRCFGKVIISAELIEANPNVFSKIFAKLDAIVLRCQYLFSENVFEYYIYSSFLKEVKFGEIIPLYKMLITSHFGENGSLVDFEIKLELIPGSWSCREHQSTLMYFIEKISKGGK